MAPLVSGDESRRWIQSVAAGCYATASSSGSLFFALNFGDQGAAPVRSWVFRASIIQGIQVSSQAQCKMTWSLTRTQQVYISFLWCWGAALARINNVGLTNTSLVVTNPALTTSLGVVIAILMWTVGTTLFFGLPDYYRQTPGFVPGFLSGVFRRKIVLWFFIMVVSLELPYTCSQPQMAKRPILTDPLGDSELLPFGALRSQLAVLVVFAASAHLGRCSSCHPLFRRHMGRHAPVCRRP